MAVKIQYPHVEALMRRDLRNLRRLAEFLQKNEFKFDLLSSIIELQRQIGNEFDFVLEARNMDTVGKALARNVPEIVIPKSIMATKRLLVMTFIEGSNLGRMAEFRDKAWHGNKMPRWIRDRFATHFLGILAKVMLLKQIHVHVHSSCIFVFLNNL